MFGPFATVNRQARANAANWLELARKVFHYRRDLIRPADLAELESRSETVRAALRAKSDPSRLNIDVEALESVLRRVGGPYYPKSEMNEWVEFLVVAAIVILGIRAYFITPFQIPTNSMWPSYFGMTPKVYHALAEEPSGAGNFWHAVTQGASSVRLDAPAAGEVLVELDNVPTPAHPTAIGLRYEQVSGRKWFLIPAPFREYRLIVGGASLAVRVPQDFDFDWVLRDTFFPGKSSPRETLAAVALQPGNVVPASVDDGHGGVRETVALRTHRTVRAGERVLSFDILAGDMLMVDRLSYHFVRPSVGDGFVFHTGAIPALTSKLPPDQPADQYYIKRLVGLPGDKLELRQPVLYRNGAKITGAAAFDRNATQEGDYPGYRNGRVDNPDESQAYLVKPGDIFTVPPKTYFAMGDNSASSWDGRYWGPVPESAVVGRPILVYFPFTARWLHRP